MGRYRTDPQLIQGTFLVMALTVLGCGRGEEPQTGIEGASGIAPTGTLPITIQAERDNLCMLLAYGLVLKNWQRPSVAPDRGHNVGAVLVDPNGEVVDWALNCCGITGDSTQHAEVRLIQGQLRRTKLRYLPGYTVYTTLEPCAMCSGMMMMAMVGRVVYGQTDPGYGRALERLSLDSRSLPAGLPPYPRSFVCVASDFGVRLRLDATYSRNDATAEDIVAWLRTDEARKIYAEAGKLLIGYQVAYDDNVRLLKSIRVFHQRASDHYVPASY